ncbi:MAG: hypothetical protein V1848_03405 [Candidatus Magasanikbacteria bacterium]
MSECCPILTNPDEKKKSIISGIWSGILPHSFCILVIILSTFGSFVASTFFKKILLMPYFSLWVILLSLIFATISAFFFLKKIIAVQKRK